jgi:hypothetical protein
MWLVSCEPRPPNRREIIGGGRPREASSCPGPRPTWAPRAAWPPSRTCPGFLARRVPARPPASDPLRAVLRELGPGVPGAGHLCNRLIRAAVAEEVSGFRARRRAYRVHGPRFAAPGSADRSRPPERSAQAAGRRVREPGRPLAPRRVDTTADAGGTATPPARAPERDGDRRMSSFSSRSRTRRRSARSPASRCPLVLATAASAATATPPPEAAQAHAGPRPRSELPRGCARRATANAGRRARARVQGREWRRPPRAPPRSRRQAPAARWRRSPSTRQRLSTAAGIAGGARSSSQTVTHAMFLQPAQSSRRCSHRLGTLQRSSRAGLSDPID